MRTWPIILLLLGPSIGSAAHAQDVMSDNELFASYCFGYLNDAYQEARPALDDGLRQCRDFPGRATSCADLRRMAQQAYADMEANLGRLKRYLLARGILTIRNDVPVLTGLLAATNQGRSDFRSCLDQMQKAGILYDETNRPACAKRCDDLSRIPM